MKKNNKKVSTFPLCCTTPFIFLHWHWIIMSTPPVSFSDVHVDVSPVTTDVPGTTVVSTNREDDSGEDVSINSWVYIIAQITWRVVISCFLVSPRMMSLVVLTDVNWRLSPPAPSLTSGSWWCLSMNAKAPSHGPRESCPISSHVMPLLVASTLK